MAQPATPPAAHSEHFAHGADLGVRGYGRTLAEAFEQTALALAAAVVDPSMVRAVDTAEIHCEAPDPELLLVDWLNGVIYEMATHQRFFASFSVDTDGAGYVAREQVTRHQAAAAAFLHECALDVFDSLLREHAARPRRRRAVPAAP